MKFTTKLQIDRTVGRLLCFALIPFVYILGIIMRRDHTMTDDNVKCIVVAKYFGLGSITHAMPMLRALKERYPDAKVVFVSRKSNASFFALISDIDAAYYIDDSSIICLIRSSFQLLYDLIRLKVDLFFDLEVFSTYGTIVSLFSLARNRLGFFASHSTNFKVWIYTHLMYFNFHTPVRLCYMQLARLAGAGAESSIQLIPYAVPDAVRNSAEKRLKEMVPDRHSGLIAINANASELSFARRWPLDRFTKVAEHFAGLGYHILLLGSPEEHSYVERIKTDIHAPSNISIHPYIHNVAGRFPLLEVPALLQLCDAFVTTDSGLMNFAYAQGVKTISLHGPNIPHYTDIDNNMNVPIYKNTYCSHVCIYSTSLYVREAHTVCLTLKLVK